jgi:hypothetical protein
MTETDVRMALINYRELSKSVKKLGDKIEEVNAKRFSCGGSIAKRPENPRPRDVVIIENLMKLDQLLRNQDYHGYLVHLADWFIHDVPEPYHTIFSERYVNGHDPEWIAQTIGFSTSQIYRILTQKRDVLIEQFIGQL